MVNILPKVQGFGEKMGAALGGGFGGGFTQGMGRAQEFAEKLKTEKAKAQQGLDLYNSMKQKRSGQDLGLPEEDKKKKFIEMLPELERMNGQEFTPENLDEIWKNFDQVLQVTGQGQQQGQQQRQMQSEDPYEEAELLAALGHHDLSRVSLERAKQGEEHKFKSSQLDKKLGQEEAKPTLARGRKLFEELPSKENALSTMKESIQSNNLGMLSLDNLAEMTGIEGLRTPEGATFKTASKEFFLGNLSRIGAKGLNQMMEKVVQEMSPLIGRSTQANLAVSEILESDIDVGRREAELISEIAQSYKEKHGMYPEDLSQRVYKELHPYAKRRQKEALEKVDKIKEQYEPKNKTGMLMYDPSGNLRRVPHANIKEAKKEGYRSP